MKSIVKVFYKRPKNKGIYYDGILYEKSYANYKDALSTAIDNALRIALDGYYVKVTCDDVTILEWDESFIRNVYHY